jgi:mycoredoxin
MDNVARNALIVYGHDYCGQARALKKALTQHQVAHEWRDVLQGDARYRDELKQLARGNLSVPTVIFPDGTVMVEPLTDAVLDYLKLREPSRLQQFMARWR